MSTHFVAAPDDDERRLDRILRKLLPDLPLSALHRLLRKGKITVNGKAAAPDERIRTGQVIEIPEIRGDFLEKDSNKKGKTSQTRQLPDGFIKIIIYEGEGLLVLNKPSGLAVHGPDSLNEQVCTYLKPKLPPSLSFKPGPLHRLDKPSSGLIVFSTNLNGARLFSALLREQKIHKQYLAIVDGILKTDEFWEDALTRDYDKKKTYGAGSLDGKNRDARTKVSVLAAAAGRSLILAEIETGRTHQIRAQAALHGHPLSGDRKYGGKRLPGEKGFLLHAWKLEFKEPCLSVPARFEASLPDYFHEAIDDLFGIAF
jgi:23S rRNA pseudouridine955/2504/2580 synthase